METSSRRKDTWQDEEEKQAFTGRGLEKKVARTFLFPRGRRKGGKEQKCCKSGKLEEEKTSRFAERARGGRLSLSLSPVPPYSLSMLSLSLPLSVWFHVQVARPPIGGRERRCAWVGEAW